MKPYVIINIAMSADGKISTKNKSQLKISGVDDFQRVDALKSASDGIMVGINTIIFDNPKLTIKNEQNINYRLSNNKSKNPTRIIIDSQAKIDVNSMALNYDTGNKILVVSKKANSEKINILSKMCKVIVCGDEKVDLKLAMEELYELGIHKILVEGGGTLNFSLIQENLVDEIYCYIGNIIVGGYNSPTLADGSGFDETTLKKLFLKSVNKIDDGVLLKWKVL